MDRQPEFTQIDCEMAFVNQQDVIDQFENLIKHLFKKILNVEFEKSFPELLMMKPWRNMVLINLILDLTCINL